MAILHNNAGQYCKSEAMRRFQRVLTIFATALFVLGCALTLVLVNRQVWTVLVCLTVMLTLVLLRRPLERSVDQLSRESIKYMRGGRAEALVAWLIKDDLDGWHLFNNIELVPGSDVDHVLIGPGGVWCLSTKSVRGLFSLTDEGLIFYNNRPTRFVQDARERAMELRKRLNALLGNDVPFVEAVLAVPFAFVDFQNPKCGVWVVHKDNLVKTIASRPNKLTKEQIARCVLALTDLANNARRTYQRPHPELSETSQIAH